jgi:AcrR family transcriptional regulator
MTMHPLYACPRLIQKRLTQDLAILRPVRGTVLTAAAVAFQTADPTSVTIDQLARAAGVGRATLYRRYPDVQFVAMALLDERERELQTELMGGAPPLGPGAQPHERLSAFIVEMVELLEEFNHLLIVAESGMARFDTGAYGF